MRILVVDDEESIRSILTQVLAGDGHDVTAASSGEEALEVFRRQPFPLVMTDIYMGKMNGLELLKEIRLLDPESMVVVITSNASLETATEALRAGAADYLTKPFEDIELVSAVIIRAIEKLELQRNNTFLLDRLKKNAAELERVNGSLRDLANRDGLTGLYNHRYFREALERELARSERGGGKLSLVFIDIDHFKQFNDTHGHLAGDQLLRELSQILRLQIREASLVARYGGDEFVLMLPDTGRDGAQTMAERIRSAVERHPFDGAASELHQTVTLSGGVATFPDDAADDKTLIECADRALYRAKSAGRNFVGCPEEEVETAAAVKS